MPVLYFLKVLLKGPFDLLKSREGRKFLKYCFILGIRRKTKESTIRLNEKTITVADRMSFLWQYHEIYYSKSYLFNTNKDNPLILDIGANIGLASLFFRQQYPSAKILAFEPNPRLFSILTNNLRHSDVEIHQEAIWSKDGELEMGLDDADTSSIHKLSNKEKVKSRSLVSILKKFEQIDMLKVDIEGAEIEVFSNCEDLLKIVDNIFVEYHSFHHQPQRLSGFIRLLEKEGFRYFVQTEKPRKSPLKNHFLKNEENMDMRLNIYAYRV